MIDLYRDSTSHHLPPITHGAYLLIMYAPGSTIAMLVTVPRRAKSKEPPAKSSGSLNTQTATPVIMLIAIKCKEKMTMESCPTCEIALETGINLAKISQKRMPEKLPRKKRPKFPYSRNPIAIGVLNFNENICKPRIVTSDISVIIAFGCE